MAPETGFVDGPAQVDFGGLSSGPLQQRGDIASTLINYNGDKGALRPIAICNSDGQPTGQSYICLNDRRGRMVHNKETNKLVPLTEKIVLNNPAALRFQDWRLIDEAVVRVAKPRLRYVADLRSSGLEVSLANGMGFTVFSYEDQSDVSPATTSMDGLRRGQNDRPVYNIHNLPLPIIHKDFSFSTRQVMASRNGYSPLDTTTAELAARRVAEAVENLALGVSATYTFGGGTVYGLTNFTNRLTATMTNPNHAGWTPQTTLQEILAMQLQSRLAFHYGPWNLYVSPNWEAFLDEDFSSAKGDNTLRQRLEGLGGINKVEVLDYLQFLTNSPYTMILCQMTPDVNRIIMGLDITTLQWESHGGMQMNFKVMCIIVPQLRADQNLNTGIVHGTAASS